MSGVRGRHRFDWEKFRRIASPSTHEILPDYNQSATPTKLRFKYGTQRLRLLSQAFGQWLCTLVLCLAIFGQLYGYSTWHTLTPQDKRVFNALISGLSIALGINLTSSLRSYAKALRWRILAGRYRSLSQFELLLGADRQSNVIRLIWSEFFNVRRKRHYLPSWTQVFCILWLLLNLAVQILVAIIGLTYNLDQSSEYVLTQTGNVSVVDFSTLTNGPYESGLSQAWLWGTKWIGSDIVTALDQGSNEPDEAESDNLGLSRYWFIDYNPDDINENVQTGRYVDAQAYCQAFDVVQGGGGKQGPVIYNNNGRNVTVTYPEKVAPGPGGMLFVADRKQSCGPRCVNFGVLQALSQSTDTDSAFTEALYFVCNNTVSQVQYADEGENIDPITDEQARMLAGAVGWSGSPTPGDTREFQAYGDSTDFMQYLASQLSFEGILTNLGPIDVANILSQYTISAVANADDARSPSRYVFEGSRPVYADYLRVKWWHAGSLLIVIPCLHLMSMCIVIWWAGNAIIKDDSYLASAKLYYPLIQELGDHGCIMRGDQIVKRLGDPVVAYGYKDVASDTKHVDVFKEGSGMKISGIFEEGDYDGAGDGEQLQRIKSKID